MSAYKDGHCAQCGKRVAIRDVDGKLNSFKSIRREATLHFKDGTYMLVAVCVTCLGQPDFAKVMISLKHKDSQAGVKIRQKELPVKMKEQPTGLSRGGIPSR